MAKKIITKKHSGIEFVNPTSQHKDYQKFYMVTPEEGFSPEKNKYVIQKTIEKSDKARRAKIAKYHESIAERSEAVYDYIKYVDKGGNSDIDKYFGKRNLAYLRGQKVIQKLQSNGSIILEEI